jgi:hypothetical protein
MEIGIKEPETLNNFKRLVLTSDCSKKKKKKKKKKKN